jgi:flagellar motor protein MotB
LSWTGVGSSEPRYRPESNPENQSRNRRVEIVHVRGA